MPIPILAAFALKDASVNRDDIKNLLNIDGVTPNDLKELLIKDKVAKGFVGGEVYDLSTASGLLPANNTAPNAVFFKASNGDNIAISTSATAFSQTETLNSVLAANISKIKASFLTDSRSAWNPTSGTTDNVVLAVANEMVSPIDSKVLGSSLTIQQLAANCTVGVFDINSKLLTWNNGNTQWEDPSNVGVGVVPVRLAVIENAASPSAAVSITSSQTLDAVYFRESLRLSRKHHESKLDAGAYQITGILDASTALLAHQIVNGTLDSSNVVQPAAIANAEIRDGPRALALISGFATATYDDIQGITTLPANYEDNFTPKLVAKLVEGTATVAPFDSGVYSTLATQLVQNNSSLTKISQGEYDASASANAAMFKFMLVLAAIKDQFALLPTADQIDRMLGNNTSTQSNYTYGASVSGPSETINTSAKKIARGASPAGLWASEHSADGVLSHMSDRAQTTFGQGDVNRIITSAISSAAKQEFFDKIFLSVLKGDTTVLDEIANATLPASSSLQDHKLALAQGLNGTGAISTNWVSRSGLFASSPSKDDLTFEAIMNYYKTLDGKNPLLDSDIRRNMRAKRYLALGSTTTGIDITGTVVSTRGFFSPFKNLVGTSSVAKDEVFVAPKNASGVNQTNVEKLQEAQKVIDTLQAEFGASDEIAVQAKNANRVTHLATITPAEMLQIAQGYTKAQREIFAQYYNATGNTATTSGLQNRPLFVSDLVSNTASTHKKAIASLLFNFPELDDASKTVGTRALALAGQTFNSEDARVLMNSILGALTTAISWTASTNQKIDDLAALLNGLYRTNTTDQMDLVEVDSSSASAFTIAISRLFVAAPTGSVPTTPFASQITVNSNNFDATTSPALQASLANMSLMTDIWYNNFIVAENAVSKFYKNIAFDNATFITTVGNGATGGAFVAQYSLVHHAAFADNNDELELQVAEALRSDGVSVPLMKNGIIRVFAISADGRTLSSVAASRYFMGRSAASKI